MSTSNKNPGNFSNDREKASQAGKKGGQASGGNNTSSDRSKPSETGKKSGSHGGGKKS